MLPADVKANAKQKIKEMMPLSYLIHSLACMIGFIIFLKWWGDDNDVVKMFVIFFLNQL